MSLKDGLLNELTSLLRKSRAIAAILFGSMARGGFNNRSDIDALLIYKTKGELESDKDFFDDFHWLTVEKFKSWQELSKN